jgi:hypothetical protein
MFNAARTIINEGKEKYSSQCRSIAEKYFDDKIQFEKYITLYKDLLNV